ncbi:MAG TPA: cache domain-containing protein [Anaeromyxobacteraceae bacterium]|nr:cache domain-containing protein [Anaeromyxobacteraceae bacterium]
MTFSIRAKLVLAIFVTLGVAAAGSALLVRQLYLRTARAAAVDALRGASVAYEDLEKAEVEKLTAILDTLVANVDLRDAFAARDRDKLQAVALPIHTVLKKEHGIGHWNFVDAETMKMFLRPHLPKKFDDVIERPALTKAVARRENSVGKELGKSAFALRVGRPFWGADGNLIGYIELGTEIEHFLDRMKTQTGNDFAMFIEKRLLDESEWARTRALRNIKNTWGDFPGVVVTNSTTPDPLVDESAFASTDPAGTILDEVEKNGTYYARGVFPVRESSGNVVGGLVVRHDITALRADMQAGLYRALGLLGGLALLASILVYPVVNRLIFRRLSTMMETMEDMSARLAGGDYSVGSAPRTVRKDELGKFESFFADFVRLVGNTLRAMSDRVKQQQARPPAPRPPPAPLGR